LGGSTPEKRGVLIPEKGKTLNGGCLGKNTTQLLGGGAKGNSDVGGYIPKRKKGGGGGG